MQAMGAGKLLEMKVPLFLQGFITRLVSSLTALELYLLQSTLIFDAFLHSLQTLSRPLLEQALFIMNDGQPVEMHRSCRASHSALGRIGTVHTTGKITANKKSS